MKEIIKEIQEFYLEELACTIAEAGAKINEDKTVDICFGFPIETVRDQWLKGLSDQFQLPITLRSHIEAHRVQSTLKGVSKVKNCIAIASGKGGVGKSTVTANLAVALSKLGARVGVLDADIYGPSQPMMLGASDAKPESIDGRYLKPVLSHHQIQVMSMGYLLEQDNTPVVWRGPMVSKALQQLLFETLWDDLDYLLIDLPPGTGDIQLTLCQKIPLSGSVIVTTPQDIALLDVKKAVRMFEKVSVNVMGVIENMSHYHCPQCHYQDNIFGEGGAEKLQAMFHLNCLGQIPLDRSIREASDLGKPMMLSSESQLSNIYFDIALRLGMRLALQAKNYTLKFPEIVIEKG